MAFPDLSNQGLKVLFFCFFLLLIVGNVFATEGYAEQAEVKCLLCHLDRSGGGELAKEGQGYAFSPGLDNPNESGHLIMGGLFLSVNV